MTNTTDIQEALKRLEDLGPKTTAAKLRTLSPVIEAKLAAGIRHADIHASLREAGIDVSMATYKGTLQRLRKEARRATPAPALPSDLARPASSVSAPPSPALPRPPAPAASAGKDELADVPTHGADGLPLTPKQRRELVADQFVPRAGAGLANPRLKRLLNKDTK